jgi:hypothetical protein
MGKLRPSHRTKSIKSETRHDETPFIRRVAEKLLPLSKDQSTVYAATPEWRHTGVCDTDPDCSSACGLCGHEGLKFLFQIRNRFTRETLFVGSECIKRFQIVAVHREQGDLDLDATEKLIGAERRQLANKLQHASVVMALVELERLEDAFNVDDLLTYYEKRGAFTAKQLAFIVWRLEHHGVPYEIGDFKVIRRRTRERQQLLQMELWKLERIWGALSPQQRQWCEFNRSDCDGIS